MRACRGACHAHNITPELAVILVSTRNPLNIGAAARAVANFGFDDLRLVDPYDVAFREAVSAVGGAHVLRKARVFSSVADAVSDCSLVLGTTAAQHRVPQQSLERLESGMAVSNSTPVAMGTNMPRRAPARTVANNTLNSCPIPRVLNRTRSIARWIFSGKGR